MSKHLEREIERLKKRILALSALVEASVHDAVVAIERRDATLARKIIEGDIEIDHSEVDVEEECLKILALHQPVAIDLRFIVACLKINNDLERIADLAVNIAERAVFLCEQPRIDVPFDFAGMAEKAKLMLKRSLDALVNKDASLARAVIAADDEVDAINRDMYDRVKEGIVKKPEHVHALIHMLSTSRHLERIADHATNIAEDVIYMIDGEIVRHKAEDFSQNKK
ncbi:MAG: phosphate signaling complex protein PhoU [Planctomycetota bacterium]|nr:phosphate signaling complex protein PhoU [Planctomycetota bacterium]